MATVPALLVANCLPACSVLWALARRGRYWSPPWCLRKIFLVRSRDGRKPSRLQAAGRAILVWAPVSALFSLSAVVGTSFPILTPLAVLSWFLVIPLLIVYAVLAMCLPNQSLHDRLAGTYLVPE
jgi:hypothetical protein